ncbi:MAG: hypothetical protein HC801_04740 [Nitrospira sp.]|nr:hypothetical protein [Nitrospira sp.]
MSRQTPPFRVSLIVTMRLLNLALGTAVATVGFWLIWGSVSPFIVFGWAITVGLFLWVMADSISKVWAWSTLVLGIESFVWPLVLMVQLKGASDTVPEAEMGTILSAVVLGLFSSVFWVSFSYGLFNRALKADSAPSKDRPAQLLGSRVTKKKKKLG